jgi:hypothetical protein
VNDRGFLLDTNVVSELVRATPHASVLSWIRLQRPTDLFLAAVSLGEIVRGVVRVPTGSPRSRLETWVTESLPRQFAGRILAFDQQAAVIWGELMGTADRTGRTRTSADAQIAATAIQHNLVLVTRNAPDFRDLISALVNPWD